MFSNEHCQVKKNVFTKGRINVLTDKSFLHSIHPGEFLDSPEFESSKGSGRVDISESTFKVTICAAGSYFYVQHHNKLSKKLSQIKRKIYVDVGFPKMLLETNRL